MSRRRARRRVPFTGSCHGDGAWRSSACSSRWIQQLGLRFGRPWPPNRGSSRHRSRACTRSICRRLRRRGGRRKRSTRRSRGSGATAMSGFSAPSTPRSSKRSSPLPRRPRQLLVPQHDLELGALSEQLGSTEVDACAQGARLLGRRRAERAGQASLAVPPLRPGLFAAARVVTDPDPPCPVVQADRSTLRPSSSSSSRIEPLGSSLGPTHTASK